MQRFIALLRGINLGGHTVKMDTLRQLFEQLHFSDVETVIASGNVVFESEHRSADTLEREIAQHLEQALGFSAPTFLRTIPELRGVLTDQPFEIGSAADRGVVYVIFLRECPTAAVAEAIGDLRTSQNEARVGKREIYWFRRAPGKESDVFGVKLGKLLGKETTARNLNTIQRIVDKYG